MGVEFDPALNNGYRQERNISKAGSRVQSFVTPTNEEIMIARDATPWHFARFFSFEPS